MVSYNGQGYVFTDPTITAGGALDPGTAASINQAAAQANASGQKNTGAVLQAIIAGGVAVLTAILGIIQAKQGNKVLNEQVATGIVQGTGGNLDLASLQSYQNSLNNRQAEIFGIPLSTIVIILGGILLYQLFAQNKGKKK